MRRKKWFAALAGVLCLAMCAGLLPQGMEKVQAENEQEGTVYKRIQCHNTSVDYFVAVDETDAASLYAATSADYGTDHTVWIEEKAGETESGNQIVKLKSYATGTYMGVQDSTLKMMEDDGTDAVKWEVQIKMDDAGDWTGAADFAWNRYRTLANDENQYICTQGLDNQAGALALMTPDSDAWWSNEWKYVEVSEDELIMKPGAAATEQEKENLTAAIADANAFLAKEAEYRSVGIKALKTVVDQAQKAAAAENLTGTTVTELLAKLQEAEGNLEGIEDSQIWPVGEMAITGQDKIGDKGSYYLDFDEEFDGSTLDTDKWLDEYLPHWTSDESKSQARYELSDGKLTLKINETDTPWSENDGKVIASGIGTFNKNNLHNFTGANTLYEHPDSTKTDNNYFNGYTTQYGYIEMRAKLENDNGGGHQALWLVGTQSDAQDWANSTQTAEIDMLETPYYATDTWRNCSYGWNDPDFSPYWISNNEPVPSGDPGKEYHTYGMEWTPTELNFYYDGEYYMTIPYSPDYEMGIILSMYVNAGFSGTNIGKEPADDWPKEFCVDYLRVYKPVGGYDNGYADNTALGQVLEQAKTELAKKDTYTAESLEVLEKAVGAAQEVYDNGDATKAEITEQIEALQNAVEGLKEKGDDPVVDDPGDDDPGEDNPVIDKPVTDKPVTDNPVKDTPVKDSEPSTNGGKGTVKTTKANTTVTNQSVKTGDTAPIMALVGLLGIAMLTGVIVMVRKKDRFKN